MGKHLAIFVIGMLIVLGLLVSAVAYKLDYNELAVIKTFGKAEAIDGKTHAGLKFKWPLVQQLTRYDAGWNFSTFPETELTLKDQKNVICTLSCNWRIADPVKFNRNAETIARGEDAIRTAIYSARKILGNMNMGDLVNTDPEAMKLDQIEKSIRDQAAGSLLSDWGIELGQVSMTGLALPSNVTQAVIAAQKAERQAAVMTYTTQGQTTADAIRSRADAASKQVLAFADRKAELIKAEGIQSTAKLYEKFQAAPKLSIYLRSLESLQKELSGSTTILLDPKDIPALKLLQGEDPFTKVLEPVRLDAPATQPASEKSVPNKSNTGK